MIAPNIYFHQIDDDFDTVEEDEVSQPAIVKKTPAPVQSQPLPTVSFSTLSRSQAKGTRQSGTVNDIICFLVIVSICREKY